MSTSKKLSASDPLICWGRGLVWGGVLALLNMPYALLFGLIAGLLEVIPFVGPLLAATGPMIIALTISPFYALMVAIFFLATQQLEDKLIVPQLQSRQTGLHPLTVILSTLALGSLFGILGVLLAVPVAAAGQAMVVCGLSCFYHPEGADAWLAERLPRQGSGSSFNRRNSSPSDSQDSDAPIP